jgi:uncharacterized membrane protein YdjX (TVP38/TMEM64 family)
VHHINDLGFFIEYIRSFGYWAPAIALMLFIIQAAVPIFPFAVLVAVAVILFGFKIGFMLSVVGATLGSIVCYWICKRFGSEWFNRKILSRWGYDTSNINSDIAFWGIVLAHQIPVFPSAVIAATAALSQVSWLSFVGSTALGMIPPTMVYGGVGHLILHVQHIHKILPILAIILLVLFLCKGIIREKLAPPKISPAEEDV